MRKRLWKVYSRLMIRTPIAAIVTLLVLLAGLYLLLSNVHIATYLTVTGTPEAQTGTALIRVEGEYNLSAIREQDRVIWYTAESGERYEGTVIEADAGSGYGRIEIAVSSALGTAALQDWMTGLAGQPVYVDLPQGSVPIYKRIFHRGASS